MTFETIIAFHMPKVPSKMISSYSILKPKLDDRNSITTSLKIGAITFNNVTFLEHGSNIFKDILFVDAKRKVTFIHCMIELGRIPVIDIFAEEVIFESSLLKWLGDKSTKIHANEVSFVNTTLKEPLEHSMKEIVSKGDQESVLKLINVNVQDPKSGTFVSMFPKVVLQNITVDKCFCGYTLKDITCKDTDFKSQHDRSGFATLNVNCSNLSVRQHKAKNIYLTSFLTVSSTFIYRI